MTNVIEYPQIIVMTPLPLLSSVDHSRQVRIIGRVGSERVPIEIELPEDLRVSQPILNRKKPYDNDTELIVFTPMTCACSVVWIACSLLQNEHVLVNNINKMAELKMHSDSVRMGFSKPDISEISSRQLAVKQFSRNLSLFV